MRPTTLFPDEDFPIEPATDRTQPVVWIRRLVIVQEKQRAHLAEIIEKVNDLFSGDLTDHDKLVYVNDVAVGDENRCEARRVDDLAGGERPENADVHAAGVVLRVCDGRVEYQHCPRDFDNMQWVFDAKFAAPVNAKGVRVLVRACSYDDMPDVPV